MVTDEKNYTIGAVIVDTENQWHKFAYNYKLKKWIMIYEPDRPFKNEDEVLKFKNNSYKNCLLTRDEALSLLPKLEKQYKRFKISFCCFIDLENLKIEDYQSLGGVK